MKKKHVRVINKNNGFSIIEVLIFTVLSSLVLITMTMATMISIRNSMLSQNRTLSTRYTQQAQEWLRGQRDIDWTAFIAAIEENATYCINSFPDQIDELALKIGTCDLYDLSSKFKRQLTISSINGDSTEVIYKVTTYWRDGPTVNSAQASGLLAEWE